MRILVTGSGGFIGSHVVEKLTGRGHSVRALVNYNSRGDEGYLSELGASVRSEIDVIAADVRDAEAMHGAVAGMDAVLHLAALIGIPYSYLAPSSYVSVNIEGTLNLLNAARRADLKLFVHTSTSEVYGSAQFTPIDESHPLVGQSPYSASKIGADKIAESFARSFDLPVVILRPFNTFGPRQSPRAVIPAITRQLLDPACGTVRTGTLATVRDFTYVEDTADAYVRTLDSPSAIGTTINLGTGRGHRIRDVLEALQKITKIEKPLETDPSRVRPAASEVDTLISDNSRALALIGWKPRWSFEDGLAKVVDYWRERGAAGASRYRT